MSHRIIRKTGVSRVAATISLVLLLPPAVFGDSQDVHWINPAGGVFSHGSNWDLGVPPTQIDRAFFDLDATYTATFTQNEATDWLLTHDGTVTFDLGGFTYTVLGASSTPFEVTNGTLALTNGTLDASDARGSVATSLGSTGDLTVDAAVLQLDLLYVGDYGSGTLTISQGGNVSNADGRIGWDVNADGDVTVTVQIPVGSATPACWSVRRARAH